MAGQLERSGDLSHLASQGRGWAGRRPRCSCEGCIKSALFCQVWVEQLMSRDFQRLGNQLDVVDRDVSDALLKAPNKGSVQPGLKRQSFLRQFRGDAGHPYIAGEQRSKRSARGLLGGRAWHPTDGWKKMCLKPRCLNIIMKFLKLSDRRARNHSFAQKRYLNTSFKAARSSTRRATAIGK